MKIAKKKKSLSLEIIYILFKYFIIHCLLNRLNLLEF